MFGCIREWTNLLGETDLTAPSKGVEAMGEVATPPVARAGVEETLEEALVLEAGAKNEGNDFEKATPTEAELAAA